MRWALLALFLALGACSSRVITVEAPPATGALCWPMETDQAYAEFQANQDHMPATREWRSRLGLLKAQLPTCQGDK